MYHSHLDTYSPMDLPMDTCSSSVLTLSIFLLQINGHIIKRNSTRSDRYHQVFRGGRFAHVIGN